MQKRKNNNLKRTKNKITIDSSEGVFLENVPNNSEFFCQDGTSFKNLEELAFALKNMRAGIFLYHVHPGKNDFANWVYDVVGDGVLAGDLRECAEQKDFVKILQKRIIRLQKLVGVKSL